METDDVTNNASLYGGGTRPQKIFPALRAGLMPHFQIRLIPFIT